MEHLRGREGGALVNRISALIIRGMTEMMLLSTMRECYKKGAI